MYKIISEEKAMEKTIITLLSDFGLKDSYVAEMKAIIQRAQRSVVGLWLNFVGFSQVLQSSYTVNLFDMLGNAFWHKCCPAFVFQHSISYFCG